MIDPQGGITQVTQQYIKNFGCNTEVDYSETHNFQFYNWYFGSNVFVIVMK